MNRTIIRIILSLMVMICAGSHAAAEDSARSDEKVVFNFVNVDLPAIVKVVSDLTGKNIIFDDQLKGKITIVAPSPIDKADAFRLFTSVLELKGYTVIPSGANSCKIIPSAEAKQKGVQVTTDGAKATGESYIARLIKLDYLSADDAIKLLRPIISKDGYLSEFAPRNMLLAIDSGPNIDKILTILKTIDRASPADYPEVIYLKFGTSDAVVKLLNDGLKKKPTSQQTAAEVFTVSDKRLNAVVIFGPRTEREPVRKLIEMLDAPSPDAQGNINVYFLENANAEELSKVLDAMLKSAKGGDKSQPNALSAVPDIHVTPDAATNSLVIAASPADYRNITGIIKQLDRKRKQVYVEAMIVEVSIQDILDLGTKWRAIGKQNGQARVIGGVGKIDSTSMQNIINGLSGLSVGGLGSFMNIPLTVIGSDGTATTSNLSVPGYAALFNISDFKGIVNVLSTPQILTSDNKEAEIMVGENIPIVTKRESSTASASGTLGVFNSIERKDVGISLKITPHITEGDIIKLDVYQEISSVEQQSDSSVLINMGPTTTKRSAKTTIFAEDGQTIVIGGLIQDKEETSITKVPLLGDIPLLGWLFKTKETTKTKINLMVFLTPHIINANNKINVITGEKTSIATNTIMAEDRKIDAASSGIYVRVKEGTSKHRAIELFTETGSTVRRSYPDATLFLIEPPKDKDIDAFIRELEVVPEIKFAEKEDLLKSLQGR
ncbi:type II secretion system protein GspD [Candidatus Magnetominusculus xianensis]|uniref:Type II secretion system protein GspD n=2 Tax=Candidatus Magnetominusculus xianensis TaxID=1748249 RepID=A0ABR5SAV8_9BACT|nr:type II secretion system protein GspD [Candidatus Magnetominusculus xianensis]